MSHFMFMVRYFLFMTFFFCLLKVKSKNSSTQTILSNTIILFLFYYFLHSDKTPEVTIVQHPKASLMHTGDSVSFSCGSNVSTGWDYMWFKNDNLLVTSGDNHSISSALTTDSGSYKCQAKRGEHTVLESNQSESVDLKISGTIIGFFLSLFCC